MRQTHEEVKAPTEHQPVYIHSAHQEKDHHLIHPMTYVKTITALTILMVITVAAYYYQLPSVFANIVAMTIAVTKGTLVVLNFMGVRFSTRLTQLYAAAGFVWVTLLGITFCDYVTRKYEVPPNWENAKISPVTGGIQPEVDKQVPRQYYGPP